MGTTDAPQGREFLRQLRDEAQSDVLRAEETLARARDAHVLAVERLSHLQALLGLTGKAELLKAPQAAATATRARRSSIPVGPVHATPARNSSIDSRAVDAAAAVLEMNGVPTHYRDIYAAVERNGVLIRSTNPANALLTRMLRDGRFRPAGQRGYYELAPAGDHKHYRPQKAPASGAA